MANEKRGTKPETENKVRFLNVAKVERILSTALDVTQDLPIIVDPSPNKK